MKPKHKRLAGLGLAGLCLGGAAFLILNAFNDNLVFFYTPSDAKLKTITPAQRIRIGGLVAAGSVTHKGDQVTFQVTDQAHTLLVNYRGMLPDLFREGQGVVAEGYLVSPQQFEAKTVLAKHDETYMPPEVEKALKEKGLWRHAE